ncbi:hypothetical protein DRP05_02285 [Archaeoglobales archaeon]|nr:MAG: hypothetical protein DRP05_02285 [Archaeoglobales archaeon]
MRDEILRLSQELEGKEDEVIKKKFWRIVGKVKRGEIEVSEEDIEELSKIRDRFFKKRIVLSAKKGSILFPIGFVASLAIFLWVNLNANAYTYILLFLSELFVIYFCFLTGRLLGCLISGIGFDGFYLYTPLEFGVKINYRDYLRKKQRNRVILYGTTLCFQGFVMVVLLIIVYIYKPWIIFIPLIFLILWLFGSIAIHYIAKTGELHRFWRELKIALQR